MSPPNAAGGPAQALRTEVAHHDHRPSTLPQEQPHDCVSEPNLFDVEPVGGLRHRDPITSVQAARQVDARGQRDSLLRALGDRELTCDELEALVYIPRYIVASRLAVMRKDGLVEVIGNRPNHHGRAVQVWRRRVTSW